MWSTCKKSIYTNFKRNRKRIWNTIKNCCGIKRKKDDVCQYLQNKFENVEFVFTNEFEKKYTHTLQRKLERFLPQFEIVQNLVNEISDKYGMPITSMQSTHSDGQWRLPNEILTIKYHPLLGWGKVSHSGYHFIDMASKELKEMINNGETTQEEYRKWLNKQ